jgi:hypothetical protein
MPSNAVAATIAQLNKLASNPATASQQYTLAQVAAMAGYPGNKASSVRQLARNVGAGANVNGQTRYTGGTPKQLLAVLGVCQAASKPGATAVQVGKANKAAHAVLLRKQLTGALLAPKPGVAAVALNKLASAAAQGGKAAKQRAAPATAPAVPAAS